MYSGSVASTCSLLSRARAVERGRGFLPFRICGIRPIETNIPYKDKL